MDYHCYREVLDEVCSEMLTVVDRSLEELNEDRIDLEFLDRV